MNKMLVIFFKLIIYLASKQVNNFKSMLNDTNSHELLAVVTAVHHERASETLDNWTQCLVKSFYLITASCVRDILGSLAFNWYVIL